MTCRRHRSGPRMVCTRCGAVGGDVRTNERRSVFKPARERTRHRCKNDCSGRHAGPRIPTKAVASSPRDTSDTRLGGIIMEPTLSSTKSPVRKKRRQLSPIIKRSINLAGHDTSVTLEGEFWNALQDIARSKRVSIPVLIDQIDKDRSGSNLSSSVRLFVLEYFKALSQLRRAT